MNVVATAPMPGIKIPSLPIAGAILTLGCFNTVVWNSLNKNRLRPSATLVRKAQELGCCWAILRYTNTLMPQRSTLTISTLLVDDEPLAREELAFLLKDFSDIEVIDAATNGLEAVQMIENLEPDLVFLDVQMP